MLAHDLPSLERHLEAFLVELDELQRTRPQLPDPLARAEAGQQIDDLLDEIAELQRWIENSPAETLQDAAVKLRRLSAHVDRGRQARLLGSALAAVERAVGRAPAAAAMSWPIPLDAASTERLVLAIGEGIVEATEQVFAGLHLWVSGRVDGALAALQACDLDIVIGIEEQHGRIAIAT